VYKFYFVYICYCLSNFEDMFHIRSLMAYRDWWNEMPYMYVCMLAPLTSTVLFDGTSNVKGTSSMFPNCPISKHSFFLMFVTYLWNSIIFLSYSRGRFYAIVVLVRIHRPFLLINLLHHEVVPAKSVIDISMTSLLASIKIIFFETAIPFFQWSIIQFLTYSSSFGHLGAQEHKVFFYSYLLWLNLSFLRPFSYHHLCRRWAKTPFSCPVSMLFSVIHDFNF